jgi:hypothetical protein
LSVWAKADLTAPSNSLGNASVYGYLLLWVELDEADYGNELKLPVRLAFNSGLQSDSSYLGRSFWCPLLEAKAYPYSERLMRVQLICGQTIYLRKSLKNPNQYATLDGKTTGELDGNKFIITESDGWVTRYKDGKIWQVQTDSGRVLTWYYRNNIATEIKEERTGNSAVKVEYGTNGKPAGFSVNGKLHNFALGQKPRVEMLDGKRVVGAMDEALNVWVYPDGKKDTYEFAVTKEVEPTLTMTNKEGVVKNYQWDAKTGWIVSDRDWRYKIESNGERPKLRRYNDKGEEEFVIVDSRNGIYQQKSIGEGSKITEVFKIPGPLYGKVRKIENVLPDGIKKTIYQAVYDGKGKLLQTTRVNDKGISIIYKFSTNEKIIDIIMKRPVDTNMMLIEFKNKEDKFLEKILNAPNETRIGDALQELGFFYIHEMGLPEKALALLPKTSNRRQRFNIQFHAIEGAYNLNYKQKIGQLERLLKEYPDQQEIFKIAINMKKNGHK